MFPKAWLSLLAAGAVLVGGCENPAQPTREGIAAARRSESDRRDPAVVRVAAPTGNAAVDIPNIRAAIAAATPGAVIQFASGVYAIGDSRENQFVVSVPGVTLQGDRRGTTLRGLRLGADDPGAGTCCDFLSGSFLLNGGHQTIRRLTFDGFVMGISIGAPRSPTGGYRVADITFRDGYVGVILVSFSDDPTTIEGNTFENLTAPVFVVGKIARIRRNLITITDPSRMTWGQPAQGVNFFPGAFSDGTVCENNVVEENTFVRYNEGILFLAFPGDVFRNNVILNNEVIDARIYNTIFIDNGTLALFGEPGLYQGNVVKDNVVRGSEGVGLVLAAGTGNRIIGNEFHDLPGQKSTYSGYPGTAIILGTATSGNRVLGNKFENVVNTIVDLGTDNRIQTGRERQISAPVAKATREDPRLRMWGSKTRH